MESPVSITRFCSRLGRPSRSLYSRELIGDAAGGGGLVPVVLFVRQAEFQGGGGAEDFLGAGGVLHAGELHHDAVAALLLDDRLGHAQFVDPVAQGGNVLLQGEIALFLDFRLAETQLQTERSGWRLLQGRQVLAQRLGRLVAFRLILEFHLDAAAGGAAHRDVLHFLGAQLDADLIHVAVLDLLDGGVHVHLHQEMHAAAQVEAEIHRIQAHRPQETGRRRSQIQGDDIVAAQLVLEDVGGLELDLRIGKADQQAAFFQFQAFVGQLFGLDQRGDPVLECRINGDVGPGAGNLHGRVLAKQIGQGEDQAPQHHQADQQVLPPGVLIQGVRGHDAAIPAGRRAARWRWIRDCPCRCPWASANRRTASGF